MSARNWIQITIDTPEEYHDLLVGQIAALGFEGFQQEDRSLQCFIRQPAWTQELGRGFRSLVARFQNEFPESRIRYDTQQLADRNWNLSWERQAGIVEATDRIVIKPSWKKLRKRDKGKIVLHIDPKMSFGTGHHETTRLCLFLLQEYVKRGGHLLDFGCGTGVLAIAAVKLGARSALAVDNDPWALGNARENVKRNRLVGKVQVASRELSRLPNRKFDTIVSNIDLPTITATLPLLVKKLRPEGAMLLSGLLTSDLSGFLDLLSHQNLLPMEIIDEDEWAAVALMKAYASERN
jgi:ribosomal protein L11 methyltransferase